MVNHIPGRCHLLMILQSDEIYNLKLGVLKMSLSWGPGSKQEIALVDLVPRSLTGTFFH
jgi:hypothetical protein